MPKTLKEKSEKLKNRAVRVPKKPSTHSFKAVRRSKQTPDIKLPLPQSLISLQEPVFTALPQPALTALPAQIPKLKTIVSWASQRVYLLLGIVVLLTSLTLTARALITVSDSGVSGNASVSLDSLGTLNIGTASSTGIYIGRAGQTVSFPGNLSIPGITDGCLWISSGIVSSTGFACGFGNAATATTSINLAGGFGGSIPYQTASGTTAMLANGTAGQVLTSAGTTLAPAWTTPTTGSSSSGICQLASSLGFLLNGTDETTLLNSTFAAFYSAGGGCLAIDANKTLRADGQITLPAAGAGSVNVFWAGPQPPYRITGYAGAAAGQAGEVVGGSVLDLRYHGSGLAAFQGGPKLLSVGQGMLEIDHITIKTGAASDCATFLMTTGTTPYFHDLAIYGTGCNGGIVVGGSGPVGAYPANSPLSTAVTGWFNGYGGSIENVKLFGIGNATAPGILLQSQVNAFYLRHTYFQFGGSSTAWLLNGGQTYSSSPGAAISIVGHGSGADASRSNVIDEGIIELGGSHGINNDYNCGVKLHNAEETTITNMGFYDGNSATTAFCGDSTAIKSRITSTNYLDFTGTVYTDGTWSVNNNMPYRTVNFSFDGGGSALTGNVTRCSAPLPFGGVINRFSMYADQAGNATVTVKAVAAGSYTGPASATDISNGGETMTGSVSKSDTTLTGWNFASVPAATWLAPNSIVCFSLSNPSAITWLQGNIQILEGR